MIVKLHLIKLRIPIQSFGSSTATIRKAFISVIDYCQSCNRGNVCIILTEFKKRNVQLLFKQEDGCLWAELQFHWKDLCCFNLGIQKLRHYMEVFEVWLIAHMNLLNYLMKLLVLTKKTSRWMVMNAEFNIKYVT